MLKCTFGLGHLLLTLHNQLLESLHRSWGPVVYQVIGDVMQLRSRASFIYLNSFVISRMIGFLVLVSVVLGSWKNGVSFFANLGK